MGWAKRSRDETPSAERRVIHDERGRAWVGIVSSGTERGGEEHAEVTFMCRDQPSELKRVARLDVPPERADGVWKSLKESEIEAVFRRSDPA